MHPNQPLPRLISPLKQTRVSPLASPRLPSPPTTPRRRSLSQLSPTPSLPSLSPSSLSPSYCINLNVAHLTPSRSHHRTRSVSHASSLTTRTRKRANSLESIASTVESEIITPPPMRISQWYGQVGGKRSRDDEGVEEERAGRRRVEFRE